MSSWSGVTRNDEGEGELSEPVEGKFSRRKRENKGKGDTEESLASESCKKHSNSWGENSVTKATVHREVFGGAIGGRIIWEKKQSETGGDHQLRRSHQTRGIERYLCSWILAVEGEPGGGKYRSRSLTNWKKKSNRIINEKGQYNPLLQ